MEIMVILNRNPQSGQVQNDGMPRETKGEAQDWSKLFFIFMSLPGKMEGFLFSLLERLGLLINLFPSLLCEVSLLENGLYLWMRQPEMRFLKRSCATYFANKPIILRRWTPGMQLLFAETFFRFCSDLDLD